MAFRPGVAVFVIAALAGCGGSVVTDRDWKPGAGDADPATEVAEAIDAAVTDAADEDVAVAPDPGAREDAVDVLDGAVDVGPGPDPAADPAADPAMDPAGDVDPGADPDDGAVDDGGVTACKPNGDQVLGADEVPVLIGGALTYRVRVTETPAPIADLQGSPCDGGVCWDLSAPVAADVVETDVVRSVGEFWFAVQHPADAFVVPLQAGMYAVYRRTPDALLMVGMASVDEGEGATNLVYEPPVVILKLPLAKGDAYETTAEAIGHHDGEDYPQDFGVLGMVRLFHTYRFLANGAGVVKVPAGSFPAVRLLLDLTLEARNSLSVNPIAVQHFKVYDFLAECIGLVARVRSGEGESAVFFDTATEYRRLGM